MEYDNNLKKFMNELNFSLIKKKKASYLYDNLLKTDKGIIKKKHDKIDKILKEKLEIIKKDIKYLNTNKKKIKNTKKKKKEKLNYNLYELQKDKFNKTNKKLNIITNKKENEKLNLSETKLNFKFSFYNNIYNKKNTKINKLNSLNSITNNYKKFNLNKSIKTDDNSSIYENKSKKSKEDSILDNSFNNSFKLKNNLSYNLDSFSNKYKKQDKSNIKYEKSNKKYEKNYFFKDKKIEYYIEDLKKSLYKEEDKYFCNMRKFHLKQNFNSLKKFENYNLKNDFDNNFSKIEINNNKPIIFFDLDETLIHCNVKKFHEDCETIYLNMKKIFIYKRPFLKKFLDDLVENFTLILFTASKEEYAKTVLQIIDPNDRYFKLKLFRESCIKLESGNYIKDLRIIKNINLKKCCIVDNSIISFIKQLNNGIPIIPFFGNINDNELKNLLNYWNSLKNISDITIINNLKFQFSNFFFYNDIKSWIKNMYNNN